MGWDQGKQWTNLWVYSHMQVEIDLSKCVFQMAILVTCQPGIEGASLLVLSTG